MTLRKAFTLFLCAILIFYIFSGPAMLKQMKEDYNKSLEPVHEKTEWTGVITLWDYPRLDIRSGARFSWIKSKISQFEKRNPGVYIELRELDWNEGPSFLKAAAKIGANPDIAPVGSEYFFMWGGYLEELNSYISLEERADFIDSILDTARYNGKIFGLPWMMTGYTMLLNTDKFNERNVSLPEKGEWTYEQFVKVLKQLTYDGVYGFNSFIEPGSYNTFGIIMCDGAQIIDDATGRYIFNTPEAVSGLAKLCDLKHKHKVTHPDFGAMNENQAWSTFLKGETAVYAGGSWTVPLLRKIGDNSRISFTTARFPTGKSSVPLSISSTACSYAVFKQKDAAKRKVCIDFIKFITSAETQGDLENFGYFPVRKSGKHLYENDKEMYTIQQSLYFAEHLPKVKNWSEIDLVLQTRIKEAVLGNISPEQAVKEAERIIQGLK
ncbi:MAG: ABC transporter substrate-binding protein [Lutisporaceae bacterium]|jgi:multiple sugar transport system substrate-binding protein